MEEVKTDSQASLKQKYKLAFMMTESNSPAIERFKDHLIGTKYTDPLIQRNELINKAFRYLTSFDAHLLIEALNKSDYEEAENILNNLIVNKA